MNFTLYLREIFEYFNEFNKLNGYETNVKI